MVWMFWMVIGNLLILASLAGGTIYSGRKNRNLYPLGMPFALGFTISLMWWLAFQANPGYALVSATLGGLVTMGLFSLGNRRLRKLNQHYYDWN